MPIGNQNIWDQGIGMAPTQAIFGGQQAAPTNFNPGALGADPNATPTTSGADQNQQTNEPGTAGYWDPEQGKMVAGMPPNYTGVFAGKYYINGEEVSLQEYNANSGMATMDQGKLFTQSR